MTSRAGYRWVVLAVGTVALTTAAAAGFSFPVLAPEIQEHFDLTLAEMGVVLAAMGLGMAPALLPWGLLTDRVGERVVLPLALGPAGLTLAAVGTVEGLGPLVLLLVLTGVLVAGTNTASGRAVMHWFPVQERGLALGIRQASIPLGGLAAALVLPPLFDTAGLERTYVVLGSACLVAATAAALLLRNPTGPAARAVRHHDRPTRVLRRPALWLISSSSAALGLAQIATMSFTVLFLTEGRGMSTHAAALVFASTQILSAAARIVVGHLSDRRGTRIVPMRRLSLLIAAGFAAVAAAAGSPLWLLLPVLVVAGTIAMSWNGLAFVATAEIAGPRQTGAAVGLQQTFLGVAGIVGPIAIATLVSATSWRVAFAVAALCALLGSALLLPLLPPRGAAAPAGTARSVRLSRARARR